MGAAYYSKWGGRIRFFYIAIRYRLYTNYSGVDIKTQRITKKGSERFQGQRNDWAKDLAAVEVEPVLRNEEEWMSKNKSKGV